MKRLIAAWRILIGVWLPRSFDMPLPSFLDSSATFAPDPPKVAGLPPDQQREKWHRPKRLPSRMLVRHVLRMRIDAARQLSQTLLKLEEVDAEVNASFWLAERYGGDVMNEKFDGMDWEKPMPRGRRVGKEVVGYLRTKGARVGHARTESHWAASSGDEGEKGNGPINGER